MTKEKRPLAFWGLCVFLILSVGMLLVGQTSAVFAYDFAVGLGLQEPADQMSPFGVGVNRAFGLSDTLVYVPLIVIALIGLIRRRRWALPVTAAVMGISAYWAVTCSAIFAFVVGAPGYSFVPGPEYWITMGAYIVVGIWGLFYLVFRGHRLVDGSSR